MKRTLVVGEGSRPGVGREFAIDSTCLLERRYSRLSHQPKCCASIWNEFSGSFLAKGLSRIVRPRSARPAATAGGAPRRTAPVR